MSAAAWLLEVKVIGVERHFAMRHARPLVEVVVHHVALTRWKFVVYVLSKSSDYIFAIKHFVYLCALV